MFVIEMSVKFEIDNIWRRYRSSSNISNFVNFKNSFTNTLSRKFGKAIILKIHKYRINTQSYKPGVDRMPQCDIVRVKTAGVRHDTWRPAIHPWVCLRNTGLVTTTWLSVSRRRWCYHERWQVSIVCCHDDVHAIHLLTVCNTSIHMCFCCISSCIIIYMHLFW